MNNFLRDLGISASDLVQMSTFLNFAAGVVILLFAWGFWHWSQDSSRAPPPVRGRRLQSTDEARAVAQRRLKRHQTEEEEQS
ncbi:MAG TPA: hypothetical protein VFE46_01785 [Pirellulales bacterium]|nr:hypothetical protein [Pirellulales bacterium]